MRSKITILFFILGTSALAENLFISVERNLVFDKVTTGSVAQAVAPTSTRSSRFLIRGIPLSTVIVTLPTANQPMRNGAFSIGVNQFRRETLFQLPVVIGPSGRTSINVGATRLAIASNYPSGNYEGTHSVSVRYLIGGPVQVATAKHSVTVIRSLSLTKIQDMVFSDVFPGDSQNLIPVGGERSARFQIRGEPNTLFAVTLPRNTDVKLTLSGGSTNPNRVISVFNFLSIPFPTGKLDAEGSAILRVGAMHQALGASHVAGSYAGSFTVRVTYQ